MVNIQGRHNMKKRHMQLIYLYKKRQQNMLGNIGKVLQKDMSSLEPVCTLSLAPK